MHPILNIAIQAARQASEIIHRHMDRLEHLVIHSKGAHDFVSEVDLKVEEHIIRLLKKTYPNHGFIAEESGADQADAENVWIIDPIDGTRNFLHGFPFFSISIALRMKDRIEHGVIYDPLRHECFSASRGHGARLNNHRIRVSKTTKLGESLLAIDFPLRNPKQSQAGINLIRALSEKCAGIRRTGSAALDLAYVASGRLDGFWDKGLNLWDIAAGSLIVREAGGIVCDHQGQELAQDNGEIIATNPKILKYLLQTIKKSMEADSID